MSPFPKKNIVQEDWSFLRRQEPNQSSARGPSLVSPETRDFLPFGVDGSGTMNFRGISIISFI